jgi:methyl-accepting chemotaxis protein
MMNIGVRTKMVAVFAVMLALVAAVGLTGIRYIHVMEAEFESLYEDNTRAAVSLSEANDSLWQLRYGFPQFLVGDAEAKEKIVAAESKWYRKVEQDIASYESGDRTPEERETLKRWHDVYGKYVEARPHWFDLIKAGKLEEAAAYRARTTTPFGAGSVETLGALIQLQQKVGDQKLERARAQAKTSTSLLVGLLFVALSVGIIAGYAGDVLLRRTKATGERLRRSDDAVASTSQELRASAAEIVAVAKQAEDNAIDEAAAVDETRRTMAALLESSDEIANGARAVLERVERTAEASSMVAERISKLNTQAGKITGVAETIQSIADKTDILALNASLEATRVGQAGRGFVLLGAEMRRLAETVTAAVSQIQQLAGDMRELSQSAVLAAEQGQKMSQETTDNARQISLITGQQRSGTEQVSRSMDEIQELMKQGLAGYKQTRTTADELLRTAESLARLVVDGSEPASLPKPQPVAG